MIGCTLHNQEVASSNPVLPAHTPAKAGVLHPWAMGFKPRCKRKVLGLLT